MDPEMKLKLLFLALYALGIVVFFGVPVLFPAKSPTNSDEEGEK